MKNVNHTGNQPSSNQPAIPMLDLPALPSELPTSQYLHKGENPIEKIKNNILVKVEVSKQSCYVGEPIVATYKLCSRLRSQSKVTKQPSFSGCTVVELTSSQQEQHVEKINGQVYNVFVIRKVQLTPLDAGQLTLPATSVENTVSLYRASQSSTDIFGNQNGEGEEHVVALENKPLTVTVKPIPPYSGSMPFSGAIGNFSLAMKTAENVYTTNGTNHLLLIIQGVGNLQPVKVPAINWPKGIEPFEATEKEETDRESNPIITQKTFAIPFVADAKGNYVLPPLSFTYFDPNANKYVTKATNSFLFQVIEGSKNTTVSNLKSNDIGDFDQRLFILLGAGLLAVIIGIAWYSGTRRAKLPAELASQNLSESPMTETTNDFSGLEYLYKIRSLEPEENTASFYKQLDKNLSDYLNRKFQIGPSDINIFAALNPNIAPALLQVRLLLDECTLGMYTPAFSMEQAMEHRRLAMDNLEKLEKDSNPFSS